MDVTIQIPAPVLVGTQYFVVKYRLQGTPTWTDISPKSNSSFTISGLAEGIYELWTQLAEGTSPEELCPERIDTFTVVENPDCLEYTAEMVALNPDFTLWQLEISFTVPSPAPDICEIRVNHHVIGQPQTGITSVFFAPFNSPIIVPVSNNDYHISIEQVSCRGEVINCFEGDVIRDTPECVHHEIDSSALQLRSNGEWWVVLNITQSAPPTFNFTCAYSQSNSVNSGIPDPGGSINLAATGATTQLEFQVFPNLDVVYTNGVKRISYSGGLTDVCNWTIGFSVDFDLS